MSLALDRRLASTGTRFRLFAQSRYLPSFQHPETVVVSLPPGAIQAGPADHRMYVVNAIGKQPYGNTHLEPPYAGARHPPVQPGADGHFDQLDVDSDDFSCATMYATVRRVLDIWEDYFGREIPWAQSSRFPKLELIPLVEVQNAFSYFGYLEFGFERLSGRSGPYCQNFDVLAHELGHSLVFSVVGAPRLGHLTHEYKGFNESSGDLTAIVASLHFNSVVDHLLEHSRGNLFTINELSRVAELQNGREIRRAFNDEKMSTVDVAEEHALSLPLTGAIFDIFVEAFQKALVKDGLITEDLAARSSHGVAAASALSGIDGELAEAYARNPAGFKACLLRARDYLGHLLAATWSTLSADGLTYGQVGRAILRADRVLTDGDNSAQIRACFAWRGIDVSSAAIPTAVRSLIQAAHSHASASELLAED